MLCAHLAALPASAASFFPKSYIALSPTLAPLNMFLNMIRFEVARIGRLIANAVLPAALADSRIPFITSSGTSCPGFSSSQLAVCSSINLFLVSRASTDASASDICVATASLSAAVLNLATLAILSSFCPVSIALPALYIANCLLPSIAASSNTAPVFPASPIALDPLLASLAVPPIALAANPNSPVPSHIVAIEPKL